MRRADILKKLHEKLLERRDSLRRALKGDLSLLQENSRNHKDGDYVDAATGTAEDEINTRLVQVENEELGAIDVALQRIAEGEYGKCDDCGKSIPVDRLRAVPYAHQCIDCRRKEEERASGQDAWRFTFG
ncbi:MAG: TraR/DksA family transcriptional regulator [Planctomycetota bacterium]